MKPLLLPSYEKLHELIKINPETGIGYWKQQHHRKGKIGDVVTRATCNGYQRVTIDTKRYLWHRIAYKMYHGDFDETLEIDHIRGIKYGDKKSNLRAVTLQENKQNQKLFSTNSSGRIGVSWNKNRNKWSAEINVNCKKIYLGQYKNLSGAVKARKNAEEKYNFSKHHGRKNN